MSNHKALWNTKENADAYDSYARSFPMYKETSRDLVRLAGITPGMTVVDLAAGTGATTQAIIDSVGTAVHIIALDQAEEMLKKAKEKFVGKDVRYIVSGAAELDTVISVPVDVVLCNSAFWQMKASLVFAAISNVLKPGGVFAFNLPDSFFSFEGFGVQPLTPAFYQLEDLVAWGETAGLTLVHRSIETYEKTVDEILAFNEIPVMKKKFRDRAREGRIYQKTTRKNTRNQRKQTSVDVFCIFKDIN